MTNLLFVSYSSKISSNRVNVALPYICYRQFYPQPQTVFELTSLFLSATSKQYFEQPATSFLVCSLIFI
ncbi:S1 RNA-binding domain-containing protein [Streptococcus pneumoniae]|nr:S1 RNA-binding domain-containing protein [Streptococcus pneumoniae]